MQPRTLLKFLSSCLLTGVIGTAAGTVLATPSQPSDILALQGLQSIFHGAPTAGDADLFESIWMEDAEFITGAGTLQGRDAIMSFFTTGAGWGTTASLSPTYKTRFDIQGSRAVIRFECVILRVTGDPLTTAFSTIPFGNQNPDATIFQHSTATIEAVKRRGEWRIQRFRGAAGPIVQ